MAQIRERVKKNVKKSYFIRIRMKGKLEVTASFERLTDAKLWAQQTEIAICEGRYTTTVEAQKHTLSDLVERYIRDVLSMWGDGKMGKENGQGTYTWGKGIWKGHKYEGEWKDGKEHGQGTWTWSNGQKDVGEFRGDKHWNTTNYDKNGNILGKWVKGEWIKN